MTNCVNKNDLIIFHLIHKMVYIYILQLENEKYYIGKTNNLQFRLDSHFNSNGSVWTKKYKPVKVSELIHNCDDYDEDKYTIKYMEKYGINNVRGGSFCEIKLSDNNVITLNQMIKSVTDKCYICGKDDHFANVCKKVSFQTPTINVNEKCDCPTSYFKSHRRGKCILNKIISFFDNEDDNIDKLIVQETHEPIYNNDKLIVEEIQQQPKKDDSCFRCGRRGHYISSCYASKHIRGYYLK
jgi:predicted GIY-YIG superfamily endonuclease